jgi:hypothetical protein
MQIDAALICRSAKGISTNLIDLEGVGIDTFIVDAGFPYKTTLPVFVRVTGSADDTADHDLIIRVMDGDGSEQSNSTQPIRLGPPPPNLPNEWPNRAQAVLPLDASFNEPGAYLLTISVDDGPAISQPLFIQQKES